MNDREARLAPEEEAASSREAAVAVEARQLDERQQELDALHQMLAQKVRLPSYRIKHMERC